MRFAVTVSCVFILVHKLARWVALANLRAIIILLSVGKQEYPLIRTGKIPIHVLVRKIQATQEAETSVVRNK